MTTPLEPPVDLEHYDVLVSDRDTEVGAAELVRIHRRDFAPMGFRELWAVFQTVRPGKWGIQSFPDQDHLVDQVNKYHLLAFAEAPQGFDLVDTPRRARREKR